MIVESIIPESPLLVKMHYFQGGVVLGAAITATPIETVAGGHTFEMARRQM